MADVVELTLTSEPDLVPRARRLAREVIGRHRPELVDDAELLVSELVTNAALHGHPPITVRVTAAPCVRVEVADAGRHLPVMLPGARDATTGRGLTLVQALAHRWGVEPVPGQGKRIWAELDTGDRPGRGGEELDLQAVIDAWADDEPERHTLRLGQVPTDLLLAAKGHIDGVVRELALLREGEATTGVPLAPGMAALVRVVTGDFADVRAQLRRQAATAAERGDAVTELELAVGPDAEAAGERYLDALDEADRSARAADLLTLAAPPVHRLFRRWYVGAVVAHVRSAREHEAPPPVRPFASVLAEHFGRLAEEAGAAGRLGLVQAVTTELASARTATAMAEVVVDNAVRLLGVRSARVRVLTPRATLRSVARAGTGAEGLDPAEGPEIALDADLPAARVARTGQPEFIRSLGRAFAGHAVYGDRYPRDWSAHVAPLVADGRVLGVLSVTFASGELTDDVQLAVVSALAGALARAMQAPLRSEDAQRVVLELATTAGGVGSFDWDLVSGRLAWDDQLADIFGRARGAELTIEDFFDDVHPDDRARVAGALQQAVDTVGTYEAEYRIVLPDDRVRWVAARGRALPGPDGTAARVLGVALDTTERVGATARVARVMDAMSTAFFFVDRDWRFSYLNAAAERVLGRRAVELLGRSVWTEFPAAVDSEFERSYRGAVASGEPVAFDAYYPEPLNAWYEVRAWPGPDGLAVYFIDITERRRAEEAAARTIGRVGLLARVTEELSVAGDMLVAGRTLAELLVPELADWCVVTLIDDDRPSGSRRNLGDAFGWHRDPALRPVVDRYATTRLATMADDSLVVRAMESGEPQVLNHDAWATLRPIFPAGSDAVEAFDQLAPAAAVVLPLRGRHRPVGLLSVCNGPERGPFGEVELELVRDVAARAGLVLDRERLYRQQRDVAEGLQRSLLTQPPAGDRRVALRYVPAAEVAQVGGDWYDTFAHPDGSRILVIGDVVGHDVLAAAAMGQIRTLVRTVAARHDGLPSSALAEAERVMNVLGLETMATAVLARLEPPAGPTARLVLANAGHPPPLLVHPDGAVTPLEGGSPDALLGVSGTQRADRRFELPVPSTLVLYTDGLVERRDRPLDAGLRQLTEVLAGLAGAGVEELCDAVLAAMVPSVQEDDVALMVIRLEP